MKKIVLACCLLCFACKQKPPNEAISPVIGEPFEITYAKGFSIEKLSNGVVVITVGSPWPNAEEVFKYALVPKEQMDTFRDMENVYDAVVSIPVERIAVTSTTHIPSLEMLGQLDKLVGFPGTDYVSSPAARKRIDSGAIVELGANETLNTEITLGLKPDLVVGFGLKNQNKAYETIIRSHIPVVYNGDWTEETPLGKAEWIKFFAPFFKMERQADSIFTRISSTYNKAKTLAQRATVKPKVLSGALYKDIWYLPGGKSWAAQFIADANGEYIWADTMETGSLSLSIEHVLEHGKEADVWIGPSQYKSYMEMGSSSVHYPQFLAFKTKNIHTFALTIGETGGLLYYELAPNRPDIVLQDLISIFHPGLLPEYTPYFFKPLQ